MRTLALIALLLLCSAAHQPPPAEPAQGGARPGVPFPKLSPIPSELEVLGVPVLAYSIAWDPEAEQHVLFEVGRPGLLAQGERELCERRRLEILERRFGRGRVNVPVKSLGGRQVWSDVFGYAGWRIQRNTLSGHHRLLDSKNVRRAWGSREACRTVLEGRRLRYGLSPSSDRMVILLHGLGRSRSSFAAMKRALAAEGYEVFDLAYPSTLSSIEVQATRLAGLLEELQEVREVSFVTHSLGALIVREALAREGSWRQRIELGRLAMLGPPNQGSALAEAMRYTGLYQIFSGPAGRQVASGAARRLPQPDCRFGIVAGARGTRGGWNPLIPGDDDGVVGVHETRLEGAEDFLEVRRFHTFLMRDRSVISAVVHYLEHGRFRPEEPETPSGAPARER